MACVVCARKDWLESRFTVYIWREATGSSTLTELQKVDSGQSELLAGGEHLCFGNRDLIDKPLTTKRYCELFPLIPPEHLYGSSALHPADERMSWLLTPNVYTCCQIAAKHRRAVLNSLLLNLRPVLPSLHRNTSVLV